MIRGRFMRGRRRRCGYYRLARCSNVDQSLFGPTKREIEPFDSRCVVSDFKKQAECRKKVARFEKKTERVVSQRSVRLIRPPRTQFDRRTLILGPCDNERILRNAAIVTPQEVECRKQQEELTKKAIEESVNLRRDQWEEVNKKRRSRPQLTEVELELLEYEDSVRNRAAENLLNSEEDMKCLQKLIEEAKMRTAQENQCVEKEKLALAEREEQLRLDAIADKLNRHNAALEAELTQRRKMRRMKGAEDNMEIIKERQQNNLNKLAEKELENRVCQKLLEQNIEDEMKKEADEKKRVERWKSDLDAGMVRMAEEKFKREEADKKHFELTLKVQEERDAEKARRQLAHRKALDDRIERSRVSGEQRWRFDKKQAEFEDVRTQRCISEKDRIWRENKIKEEERKKKKVKDLNEARSRYDEEKKQIRTDEMRREQIYFNQVLENQIAALSLEKSAQQKKARKTQEFCASIRKQLSDKEQEKLALKATKYEEGVRLAKERELAAERLGRARDKKISELRTMGIPEKYLTKVEKIITKKTRLTTSTC